MIPRDTHDGAFYRAVLALHQDLFSLAQQVNVGTSVSRDPFGCLQQLGGVFLSGLPAFFQPHVAISSRISTTVLILSFVFAVP